MRNECLFNIDYRTSCRFGIDDNGLLTANEKEAINQNNPYVGLVERNGIIEAHCNIPNELLDELSTQDWFVKACQEGKLSAKTMSSSRSALLKLGTYSKSDVLKAAYIAQSVRFSEDYSTLIALLKAKVEGKGFTELITELSKSVPEFTYPALEAYDATTFVKMKQAQVLKYKDLISAFNRRFYNTYAKMKTAVFNAGTDKLLLLTRFNEKELEYLENEANVQKMKKKGMFDINDFMLKVLTK